MRFFMLDKRRSIVRGTGHGILRSPHHQDCKTLIVERAVNGKILRLIIFQVMF